MVPVAVRLSRFSPLSLPLFLHVKDINFEKIENDRLSNIFFFGFL